MCRVLRERAKPDKKKTLIQKTQRHHSNNNSVNEASTWKVIQCKGNKANESYKWKQIEYRHDDDHQHQANHGNTTMKYHHDENTTMKYHHEKNLRIATPFFHIKKTSGLFRPPRISPPKEDTSLNQINQNKEEFTIHLYDIAAWYQDKRLYRSDIICKGHQNWSTCFFSGQCHIWRVAPFVLQPQKKHIQV